MKSKKPRAEFTTSPSKNPVCKVDNKDFYHRHPAWRFSRSKKYESSEFGWKSLENTLFHVVEYLHNLELQTWSDILNDKKKNHFINVEDLIPEAKRLLTQNNEDVDAVFSLHISAKERIFGIIESGVGILDIIWWDPEHKICPSQKKHT